MLPKVNEAPEIMKVPCKGGQGPAYRILTIFNKVQKVVRKEC